MKRVFCIAFVLGLSVQGLLAASPDPTSGAQAPKQPWEWTDAERLAGRYDPVFLKAIRHPRSDLPAGVAAQETEDSDWRAGLNGDTNPELLMPFELFTSLLGGFDRDPHFRDIRRTILDSRLVAFGYKDPGAFWNELEPVVHDHLEQSRRAYELSSDLQHATSSEREAIQKQISGMNTCQSRAAALAAARAHFGREHFDRLLYTVVPPGSGWSLAMGADEAFHLAWLETGCQSDTAAQLVSDSATAAPARPTPYWNLGASPAKKSPWEWTDAERMAFRLDPNVIEVHPPEAAGGWKWQRIQGATHPEALFPFELFDTVLHSQSAKVQDHERENPRLFAYGVTDPGAWWLELHAVIDPYTAPNREIEDVAARLRRAAADEHDALVKQLADLQRTQCRNTAQGLTAAREHYGREAFDRFLYMVVAPELTLHKWVGDDPAKELTYQARGCGSSTNSTLR